MIKVAFFGMLLFATVIHIGCNYDDDIDGLKKDITANSVNIAWLQNKIGTGKWVQSIEQLEHGFSLVMSDGSAQGVKGVIVTIDLNTRKWKIDGVNTGATSEGSQGGVGNAPQINETTGYWQVWDDETQKYIDTEIVANATTYVIDKGLYYELHICEQIVEEGATKYRELQEPLKLPKTASITSMKLVDIEEGVVSKVEGVNTVQLCYGYNRTGKEVTVNGIKYPADALLLASGAGQMYVQINPQEVDLSVYPFELIDSKGGKVFVVGDIEKNRSESSLMVPVTRNNDTRTAEATENAGIYNLSVGFPENFDINSYNNSILYALCTQNVFGERLVSRYCIRIMPEEITEEATPESGGYTIDSSFGGTAVPEVSPGTGYLFKDLVKMSSGLNELLQKTAYYECAGVERVEGSGSSPVWEDGIITVQEPGKYAITIEYWDLTGAKHETILNVVFKHKPEELEISEEEVAVCTLDEDGSPDENYSLQIVDVTDLLGQAFVDGYDIELAENGLSFPEPVDNIVEGGVYATPEDGSITFSKEQNGDKWYIKATINKKTVTAATHRVVLKVTRNNEGDAEVGLDMLMKLSLDLKVETGTVLTNLKEYRTPQLTWEEAGTETYVNYYIDAVQLVGGQPTVSIPFVNLYAKYTGSKFEETLLTDNLLQEKVSFSNPVRMDMESTTAKFVSGSFYTLRIFMDSEFDMNTGESTQYRFRSFYSPYGNRRLAAVADEFVLTAKKRIGELVKVNTEKKYVVRSGGSTIDIPSADFKIENYLRKTGAPFEVALVGVSGYINSYIWTLVDDNARKYLSFDKNNELNPSYYNIFGWHKNQGEGISNQNPISKIMLKTTEGSPISPVDCKLTLTVTDRLNIIRSIDITVTVNP